MSEQKPTRLAKAASYFNIGRDEIIIYLREFGFEIEDNPNAKINDELYNVIEGEPLANEVIKQLTENIKK